MKDQKSFAKIGEQKLTYNESRESEE